MRKKGSKYFIGYKDIQKIRPFLNFTLNLPQVTPSSTTNNSKNKFKAKTNKQTKKQANKQKNKLKKAAKFNMQNQLYTYRMNFHKLCNINLRIH